VAAPEPLYVLATEGDRVVAGPRDALRTERVALRDARLHRPGARVDRVKLRYRARPLAAHLEGDPAAGEHAALTVALAEPADRGAPGQLACLLDGDLVVGWATIA
jgi:tRNA-specific 2-thiouridylase